MPVYGLLFLTLLNPGVPMDPVPILIAGETDPEKDWVIINDTVMGGVSRSGVSLSEKGTLIFSGDVSLRNNGGFASTRLTPRKIDLSPFGGLVLRLRGDGRTYQVRLRLNDGFDGVAYRAEFSTSGEDWETVTLPFSAFVPTFRGRLVPGAPELDPARIRQIGFLIGDKREGAFRLEVDWIAGLKRP